MLDHWISPSVIGERPPPCTAFSFSPLSDNSGVMFGGLVPGPDRPNNDVFVAELMSSNVIVSTAATINSILCISYLAMPL